MGHIKVGPLLVIDQGEAVVVVADHQGTTRRRL